MHEGIDMAIVAWLTGALLFWGVLSARFERWNLSAPICFAAIGMALANPPLNIIDPAIRATGVRELAEFALAVVLFGDAAGVSVGRLRRDTALPGRLLLVGLPLTIVAGTLAARWLLPGTSWWVCAVIGAAVAPTDAALGAAIINDQRVPTRIRQVLNVESGLNDGIATPIVNFFLVGAVAGTALATTSEGSALVEIGLGVVLGAGLGWVGGWAMSTAQQHGWTTQKHRAIGTAALAVLAYAGVVELGGNGFVAAFVAGLAFGAVPVIDGIDPPLGFTHSAGDVLSLTVWFVFGALVLPALESATWRDAAYAVLALTVVRMLPVAASLMGAGLDRATVGVIGWFGPRGLASVVFALLAVQTLAPADGQRALSVIGMTVLLSVVLHGVSAAPIAQRYGATHHDDGDLGSADGSGVVTPVS